MGKIMINRDYVLLTLSGYYRHFYENEDLENFLKDYDFVADAILRGPEYIKIDTRFNVRSHQKHLKENCGGLEYPAAGSLLDALRTEVVRDPKVRECFGDAIIRNTDPSCRKKDRDKSVLGISIWNHDDLGDFIMPLIKLHHGPCCLFSLGSYYFQVTYHQLIYLRSFYEARGKDFILIPDDTFAYTFSTFIAAWGLYDCALRNDEIASDDHQKTLFAEWCIGLVYEQLEIIDDIHIVHRDEDFTTIEELERIEINKLISIFRGIRMFYYYLKLSEKIQAGTDVESSQTKIKNLFESLKLGLKNQRSLRGIVNKYSSKKDICRILTEFCNRTI